MKAHLVGSGLASLTAATYMIKDGGFLANNITIYEAAGSIGGAMAMSPPARPMHELFVYDGEASVPIGWPAVAEIADHD